MIFPQNTGDWQFIFSLICAIICFFVALWAFYMRFWLTCVFLLSFGSALAVSTEDLTSKKFEHIRHQPEKLKAFLHDMPKGGELHYHLAGGAYPETMLGLAMKSDAYCVDLQSKMVQPKANCQGLPTSKLSKLSKSYQNIIQAWSMKGFKAGQESAHDHFFNSFFKNTVLFELCTYIL